MSLSKLIFIVKADRINLLLISQFTKNTLY